MSLTATQLSVVGCTDLNDAGVISFVIPTTYFVSIRELSLPNQNIRGDTVMELTKQRPEIRITFYDRLSSKLIKTY